MEEELHRTELRRDLEDARRAMEAYERRMMATEDLRHMARDRSSNDRSA